MAADNSAIVKSLAGTIQEKILIPNEQRFRQIETSIKKMEKRIFIYIAGLATISVLSLVLAVYNFFH